jgi:hypothetical protein
MSDVQDFTFDQGDEGVGKKSDRFKGKEGETYRVSLAWLPVGDGGKFNFDKTPNFIGCSRIFIPDVGYVLYGGPEFSRFGQVKQHVATIICVWPTDTKGKLKTQEFSKGQGYRVCPWVFAPGVYDQLKGLNNDWPMTEHDIVLACTDSQYQKMTMQPAKENLLRKLANSDTAMATRVVPEIAEQVKAISETIRNDVARKMTVQEIREKIGGAPSEPVQTTADDVDALLDDLIE